MTRRPALARFRADARGASAAEFALMAPVMLLLLLGGSAIDNTVTLSRKMTVTTRALADLTSQYQSMAQSDMTTVMNASTQILAPFNASPLGMRISEITTDSSGQKAYVTWSSGRSLTAYTAGSSFPLPSGILGVPNISFIYAETSYLYTPPFGTKIVGTINLGDRIYMLPRVSSSVSYSGS